MCGKPPPHGLELSECVVWQGPCGGLFVRCKHPAERLLRIQGDRSLSCYRHAQYRKVSCTWGQCRVFYLYCRLHYLQTASQPWWTRDQVDHTTERQGTKAGCPGQLTASAVHSLVLVLILPVVGRPYWSCLSPIVSSQVVSSDSVG